MKTRGIDVSHHNGKISWQRVKDSGIDFAYIRVGYSGYDGEIKPDNRFFENYKGASDAGLKVGVYIYSYNKDEKSAQKTARELSKILKGKNLVMPVAFDVEETSHNIFTSKTKDENARLCLSFFNALKNEGFDGILYTYTSFLQNYINIDMLKDFDLWIADYRDKTGQSCPYKGDFSIWQYKGNEGRCDGVNGPCDLNFCYKNYSCDENYKEKYDDLKSALNDVLKKY